MESLKFQEKRRRKKRGKKERNKIVGSYVTAVWELAGAQESCSIKLKKLGQSRRVASAAAPPVEGEDVQHGLACPDYPGERARRINKDEVEFI